jgi:transcriptional regulator with XRE-family HTH domain
MRGNFFYKRLGESISFYRKKNKLSQEELAAVSDIDRTYLAQIESGRANPTIKILNKLSRSLRVKLKKLFEGV